MSNCVVPGVMPSAGQEGCRMGAMNDWMVEFSVVVELMAGACRGGGRLVASCGVERRRERERESDVVVVMCRSSCFTERMLVGCKNHLRLGGMQVKVRVCLVVVVRIC